MNHIFCNIVEDLQDIRDRIDKLRVSTTMSYNSEEEKQIILDILDKLICEIKNSLKEL